MPNLREITTHLDGRRLKRKYHFFSPDTFMLKDPRNFYTSQLKDFDEQLWATAFNELLAGVSQAQIWQDKLTINSVWSGILRDEFNAVWKHTSLFQNLTCLSVFFCATMSQFDYNCLREDAHEGMIFKFLSSAPKLKKLALGFDLEYNFMVVTVQIPLAKIFGDNYVWKHLKTFYFNGDHAHMDGIELMNFWAHHSTTLKTFGLHQPKLLRGTWREIFDCIKE
ncbi:hypothetical protein RUND412_003011 [Rhizina undulata]